MSFAKDSNCRQPSDESFSKAKFLTTSVQRVSLSWLLNAISRVSFHVRRLPGIRLRNTKLPFNPVKSSKTFLRASGLESPRSVGLHGILNSTRYFSSPSSSTILSFSYLFYIHEILSILLYPTNSLFSILR